MSSIYSQKSNVRKFVGPDSIKRSYYDYIIILNSGEDGWVEYYGLSEFFNTVVIHKFEKKDYLHYYFDIEHYDYYLLIKMLFTNKIVEE